MEKIKNLVSKILTPKKKEGNCCSFEIEEIQENKCCDIKKESK